MKRLFSCAFLALLLVGLLLAPAAAPAAAQTYDVAVTSLEGDGYILYQGTITHATATADYYTQAFHIGDANAYEAYARFSADDTADVNIFVEFSNDRLTWDSYATAVDDSLGAAVVYDTLSTVTAVALAQFKANRWMRLKFDGQAGNQAGTTTWSALLRKTGPSNGSAAVANRRTE